MIFKSFLKFITQQNQRMKIKFLVDSFSNNNNKVIKYRKFAKIIF